MLVSISITIFCLVNNPEGGILIDMNMLMAGMNVLQCISSFLQVVSQPLLPRDE